MTRWIVLALVTVLAGAAGVLVWVAQRVDYPHRPGEGPLDAGAASMTITNPGRRAWTGTFGGPLLCSLSGETITVTDAHVRMSRGARMPRDVRFVLNLVAAGDDGPDPVISAVGDPERGLMLGGRVVALPGEVVVDQPCPVRPGQPRVELFTVVDSGPAGASVRDVVIDYRVDGREYALRLEAFYLAEPQRR